MKGKIVRNENVIEEIQKVSLTEIPNIEHKIIEIGKCKNVEKKNKDKPRH